MRYVLKRCSTHSCLHHLEEYLPTLNVLSLPSDRVHDRRPLFLITRKGAYFLLLHLRLCDIEQRECRIQRCPHRRHVRALRCATGHDLQQEAHGELSPMNS